MEFELTGKERFSHLEDKLFRVCDQFKLLAAQNICLKEELEALKSENLELEKKYRQLAEVFDRIGREKDVVAEKVKTLLVNLDLMENGR